MTVKQIHDHEWRTKKSFLIDKIMFIAIRVTLPLWLPLFCFMNTPSKKSANEYLQYLHRVGEPADEGMQQPYLKRYFSTFSEMLKNELHHK